MARTRSTTTTPWGRGRRTAAEAARLAREGEVRAELAALTGGTPTGEWAAQGACAGRGDDLMFPTAAPGSRAHAREVAAAKQVCGRCPVRAVCLAHAQEAGEDAGVWGGLDEDERRAQRRESGEEAA